MWYHGPSNVSSPGRSGTWYCDRHPTADTKNRADTVDPSSVVTVHSVAPASHEAAVTRVLSWMCGHNSNLPATWLRYRSTSGCAGYRSDQDHSCSSSGEKEYE